MPLDGERPLLSEVGLAPVVDSCEHPDCNKRSWHQSGNVSSCVQAGTAGVRRAGRCRRALWQEQRSKTVWRQPAFSRVEQGTNPEFMGLERETGREPATACLEGRHVHFHRLEAANSFEFSTSHRSTVYGVKYGSCQGFRGPPAIACA